MTPLGQIVPAIVPTWPVDIVWPVRESSATGVGINPDNTGRLGRISNTTNDPVVLAGTTGGSGAASNYSFIRGQQGGFQTSSGTDPSASWGFGWWNPDWSDGSDIAAGGAADALSTVAIFDLFYGFEVAASSYVVGETGFWFTVRSSNSESDEDRPNGSTPRTCFGFEAVDDGGGGQTMAFGTWDNTGTRLFQALPAAPINPLLWNSARVVVVGAGAGRPAEIFEVRINGDLVVSNLRFGTAQLQRPSTLVPAVGQTLVLMTTVEGGPDDGWFFRWRARFGTFRPDGVEVRT